MAFYGGSQLFIAFVFAINCVSLAPASFTLDLGSRNAWISGGNISCHGVMNSGTGVLVKLLSEFMLRVIPSMMPKQ
jgi:hypothetical protein